MLRGNAIVAIVIAVLALIFFSFAIVYYAVFGQLFSMDKPTGGGPSYGTGCYLEDKYFEDTSIANDPEKTFAILKKNTRYGPRATKIKSNILDILSEGKKNNLNPAIVIGMWWGEQEFGSPHKAFGYGYYDSGTSSEAREGGRNYQLSKVWTPLRNTIAVTGAYTTPTGTNRMTRLFYHYATAMGLQYKESGQRWDRAYKHKNYGNPYYKRLDVIKLLVPDQVTCETGTAPTVVDAVK